MVAPPIVISTGAVLINPSPINGGVVGTICVLLEQQSLKIEITSSTLLSSTPTSTVTLPAFKKPPEVESFVA